MAEKHPGSLRRDKRTLPEFLADSADQMSQSIESTGLRDEIDRVFQAAIIRAGVNHNESS